MSVMGSQLEIDMDPEGDLTVVPRHHGQTGTGCYRLHDHRIGETNHGGQGPTFRALPGGGAPPRPNPPASDVPSTTQLQKHSSSGQRGPISGLGQDGPGPPNGGSFQPHILDMPIQSDHPSQQHSSRTQKVLNELSTPNKKSMV